MMRLSKILASVVVVLCSMGLVGYSQSRIDALHVACGSQMRPTTTELLKATAKDNPRALTMDFVIRTQNGDNDCLGFLG